MLPAARVLNHLGPQNTGRSIEVEKQTAAETRSMLDYEMAVQQHGLHFGEQVEMPVQVTPAGLYDSYGRIGEIVHGAREKIPGRNKIGIENGD